MRKNREVVGLWCSVWFVLFCCEGGGSCATEPFKRGTCEQPSAGLPHIVTFHPCRLIAPFLSLHKPLPFAHPDSGDSAQDKGAVTASRLVRP